MTEIPKYVPKMKHTGTGVATSYRFQGEGERIGGWAIATVNDDTGEVSIQSDWGNWNYRWHASPKSLGEPTLTHFLARYATYGEKPEYAGHDHCDYLARKLAPREEQYAFDGQATIKAMRKILCAKRLEEGRTAIENARDMEMTPDEAIGRYGDKKRFDRYRSEEPLTAGIARDIWDALGGDLQDDRDGNMFCEHFFHVSGHEWITDEPWEHIVTSPTSGYQILLHGILPALVRACAEHLKKTAPAAVATA